MAGHSAGTGEAAGTADRTCSRLAGDRTLRRDRPRTRTTGVPPRGAQVWAVSGVTGEARLVLEEDPGPERRRRPSPAVRPPSPTRRSRPPRARSPGAPGPDRTCHADAATRLHPGRCDRGGSAARSRTVGRCGARPNGSRSRSPRLNGGPPTTGNGARRAWADRSSPQQLRHRDSSHSCTAHGRPNLGYGYLHNVIDDHSRLACTEFLPDETKESAAAFWARPHAHFTACGITLACVLIHNSSCYRSRLWRDTLATADVTHKRTRPTGHEPMARSSALNRSLFDEWAYHQPYHSETERRRALPRWLHTYNHHRGHTALGDQPPATRVSSLTRHNTSATPPSPHRALHLPPTRTRQPWELSQEPAPVNHPIAA